jgi:predicted PurR-regulated permease PerM
MARLISLAVLLTLIVVLGITFFRVVAPFLLPLFLAGVVALLTQPMFLYFVKRTGGRGRRGAGLATAVVVAALLVPLVVGTIIGSLQLYSFAVSVADKQQWDKLFAPSTADEPSVATTVLQGTSDFVNEFLPEDKQTTPEQLRQQAQTRIRETLRGLGDRSLGIAGGTIDFVAGTLGMFVSALLQMVIFLVSLYYFYADGTELITAAERLIPVRIDYQRALFNEFAKVVRSVVMATFIAALVQGVATTAALWLAGFENLFILFILASVAALIPMAGAWLVWGPCAVILLTRGQVAAAVMLAVYGAAVVGTLDNVVRAYVLKSDTKLHPLLALISVLGGLQVLGLWGVFIGPIVASCLHALVQIFNGELLELSRERFGQRTAASPLDPALVTATKAAPASQTAADAKPPSPAGKTPAAVDGRRASQSVTSGHGGGRKGKKKRR